MPDAAPAALGVYKPRRPQASPLFRLGSDHLHRLQTVDDDRFAREDGPWRPVVAQVADKFLACGVLEHGSARIRRIRGDACTHEYLLAFSCTCRYCGPSCPAQAAGHLDPVARHDANGARNPVALERLTYDRAAKAVTYRSDKSEGPTAGTETVDPLEFLARVLVHIPDKGHVTTRYDGWYANGRWAIGPTAALLQQLFEVDPLACPTCRGAMRIVAFITQASVIDQILAHLRARPAPPAHAAARSPPSTRAPASRGATRAPHPPAHAPTVP